MKTFKDLRVWHDAIALAEVIYRSTQQFPPDELYGLRVQLRRAAVSIPTNIAEGQGRITNGEWLQFLGHARGSLYELETQLVIVEKLGYLTAERRSDLEKLVIKVASGLAGLMNYVTNQANRRKPKPTTDNRQPATE